jgi:hypothetical protein
VNRADRNHSLHHALDELLADYLDLHPEKRPSTVTVGELLIWSHARLQAHNSVLFHAPLFGRWTTRGAA